jgi:hypothetical protein
VDTAYASSTMWCVCLGLLAVTACSDCARASQILDEHTVQAALWVCLCVLPVTELLVKPGTP